MKQITEFRRGVVRPLTFATNECVECFGIEDVNDVEYLPIVDFLFSELWSDGIFAELGFRCDVFIGDYEETLFEPRLFDSAIKAINAYYKKAKSNELKAFYKSFISLIEKAKKDNFTIAVIL